MPKVNHFAINPRLHNGKSVADAKCQVSIKSFINKIDDVDDEDLRPLIEDLVKQNTDMLKSQVDASRHINKAKKSARIKKRKLDEMEGQRNGLIEVVEDLDDEVIKLYAKEDSYLKTIEELRADNDRERKEKAKLALYSSIAINRSKLMEQKVRHMCLTLGNFMCDLEKEGAITFVNKNKRVGIDSIRTNYVNTFPKGVFVNEMDSFVSFANLLESTEDELPQEGSVAFLENKIKEEEAALEELE